MKKQLIYEARYTDCPNGDYLSDYLDDCLQAEDEKPDVEVDKQTDYE